MVWKIMYAIYIINTLSPTVILSLCPIAYSSKTTGNMWLEFLIMLGTIPAVVFIYILNDFIEYFFF